MNSQEFEMLQWGRARYRKAQELFKSQGYASETEAFKKLGKSVHEPVRYAIDKFFKDNAKPNAPVPNWLPFIWDLDPNIIAVLGIKVLFDIISTEPWVTDASFQVAKAIEDEVRYRYFKENVTESDWLLLKRDQKDVLSRHRYINKFWDKERKYHKKGRYKRFELWSERNKIRMGSWLLELIRMQSDLFHIRLKWLRSDIPRKCLTANPELFKWVEKFDKNTEILRPFYMALPDVPVDWTENYGGGYESDKGLPLMPVMKIKNKDGISDRDLSVAFEPLNKLQRVPWRINKKMLEVMDWAWESDLSVGCMEKSQLLEPLEPLKDGADDAQLTEWKVKAKYIHDYNIRSNQQRMRCLKILNLSKKYSMWNKFYFPYQLDYRGRMYSIPSYVNPQSCDFGRSVLEFYEGVPINNEKESEWLSVHGANTYGVKGSFKERIDWVKQNEKAIVECGSEPKVFKWWMDASDPWAFLHFCIEYAEFKAEGFGYLTRLPVHMDASCNGIQILSLLTRDYKCGKLTNLVPDLEPQDIYKNIADQVYEKLQKDKSKNSLAGDWLKFGIDRSFTKKIVMCKPFGMNGYTSKDTLEDAVVAKLKKGIGQPFSKQDYNEAMIYLASLINKEANKLIKPHIELMRWLKEVARKEEKLSWTTPFGLEIVQALYSHTVVKLYSIVNMQHTVLNFNSKQKGICKTRMARAIVPNFIHSLDASVMMELACKSTYAMSCIHDSFATQSPNAPKMHRDLREIYQRQFSVDLVEKFKDEVEVQRECILEDSPELGTLDVNALKDCEYIFS